MALAATTPAHAGKTDRAHQAIAAAEAKLHTAETIGAGVETPREMAEARATLATAKEDLAAGHKSSSIDGAIRASALADTAIGELQRNREASAVSAQDSVAAAQRQADEANARADAAQRAAASSAADAAAARDAAAQAQVETTVTTQQSGSARRATHTKVTRRAPSHTAAPSAQVTTTTRVTPP